MIIICINCNKKFNVDANLIPDNGRQIRCGSCNHIWYYKNEHTQSKIITAEKSQVEHNTESYTDVSNKVVKIDKPNDSSHIKRKTKSSSIGNFFSYLVVFIISFIMLIVLLDTLKSPLINIFPNLEIILFNLFETLKDLKLFIIDLT